MARGLLPWVALGTAIVVGALALHHITVTQPAAPNRCQVPRMYPTYRLLRMLSAPNETAVNASLPKWPTSRFAHKYAVYEFRDAKLPLPARNATPVLFLPGQLGR